MTDNERLIIAAAELVRRRHEWTLTIPDLAREAYHLFPQRFSIGQQGREPSDHRVTYLLAEKGRSSLTGRGWLAKTTQAGVWLMLSAGMAAAERLQQAKAGV